MGYQNAEQIHKRDVIGKTDQKFTDRSMTLKAIVTHFTGLVSYMHTRKKKKKKVELRLQAATIR